MKNKKEGINTGEVNTNDVGYRFSRETNGKLEKFHDIFEKKVKYFGSIDEFFTWYNCTRPHGALDLDTPLHAYISRKEKSESLMDPSTMENWVIS